MPERKFTGRFSARNADCYRKEVFIGASQMLVILDRAPDYESGGQEFESLRARQLNSWRQILNLLQRHELRYLE